MYVCALVCPTLDFMHLCTHAYIICTLYPVCLMQHIQNENASLKLKQIEKDMELKQVKQQLAEVRQQLVTTVKVSAFVWVSYSHELCHTNAITVVYHSLKGRKTIGT